MRQLLKITATFALALVFTAGMAFGQANEVDIEQRGGNQNTANVSQNTNPGDNTTRILQVGSKNFAKTKVNAGFTNKQTQRGDKNTALLNSFDKAGPGNIIVQQYQQGFSNFAKIDGFGKQKAFQTQVGNNNEARLIGGSRKGTVNRQKQKGDQNRAILTISGGAKESFGKQEQFGNKNRSVVRDVSSDASSLPYSVKTLQNGNQNDIVSEANGNNGISLDVYQKGFSNEVSSSFGMDGSSQTVTQIGNNHTANVSN